MEPIEIITIICCVLIVGGVLGNYIYRKIKKLPTGECGCCKKAKGKPKWVEQYRKDNPIEKEQCNCCKK